MKKFSALLAVLLFSCSIEYPKYIPREEKYYRLDFTKYKDFLITKDRFSGNYKSIGLYQYELYPEAKRILDSIFSDGSRSYRWIYNQVSLQETLDSMVVISRANGADAIVNFEFKSKDKTIPVSEFKSIDLTGFEVSGFAIKRLEND